LFFFNYLSKNRINFSKVKWKTITIDISKSKTYFRE